MTIKCNWLLATFALIGAGNCFGAGAEASWPANPIKIVVPYSPGGTVDFTARLIGQKLSEQLGKPVIIENKTGASGTLGTAQVAKSPGDGYTLLANDTTYAMLPALFAKLPWDHTADLIPITIVIQTPVVLAVPDGSLFKSMQELIDFARKNPGKLNFGSGGQGSSTHLNAEVFRRESKTDITHVPYKGAGEALVAVMGGQVDLLVTATPTVLSQIKGGKVRALAVSGANRIPGLPNVPTFKEAGLPAFVVTNWFGLAAPKGTPKEVVAKLQSEVKKALADPQLKERFVQMGAEPSGISPDEFAHFIQRETQAWTGVAKSANVKPE